MNITATSEVTKTESRGGWRRRLIAAAVAVGLSIGLVSVAAAPAQAATGVSFCFTWSGGGAYANQPVYLEQWNGSKWVNIRAGKSNASGCGTFYNTPANANLLAHAYVVLNYGSYKRIYSGYSQYYTNPGSGTVSVGKGTVSYVTQF